MCAPPSCSRASSMQAGWRAAAIAAAVGGSVGAGECAWLHPHAEASRWRVHIVALNAPVLRGAPSTRGACMLGCMRTCAATGRQAVETPGCTTQSVIACLCISATRVLLCMCVFRTLPCHFPIIPSRFTGKRVCWRPIAHKAPPTGPCLGGDTSSVDGSVIKPHNRLYSRRLPLGSLFYPKYFPCTRVWEPFGNRLAVMGAVGRLGKKSLVRVLPNARCCSRCTNLHLHSCMHAAYLALLNSGRSR